MTDAVPPDITLLLQRAQRGEDDAIDQLARAVFDELHRVASVFLRRERSDHTLQATALVHDAFLALVDQRRATWENRTQFFSVAARQMRRILVDHARRAAATKRDPGLLITLDDGVDVADDTQRLDVIRVDDALQALAAFDERQARIVELRFFAGLTVEETARALGLSAITVSRDWAVARAWLYAELTEV